MTNPPIVARQDLALGQDEQCIALAGDFRLIQKRRGHRYSVDDMLVAHLAAKGWGDTSPRRVLDLGCGLGSVLLITAWAFPRSTLVGLELQPEQLDFAKRNLRLNGCEDRVCVVAGDLRDVALVGELGSFDLVTGSPPYFDPSSGTLCQDPVRAAAHFELNGGIEDYAAAAARALAPGGRFVACAAANPRDRLRQALAGAGLALLFCQHVIPRAGKPPFLTLFIAAPGGKVPTMEAPPLTLRDRDGRRTLEHKEIRAWTDIGSLTA
jgi:tRNA1(Val) A37 N6-methylase TrmN6